VKKEGSVNIPLLDALTTNKFLPFVTDSKHVIDILSGVFKPHKTKGTGSGTNSIDKHAKKEAEDNWKKQLEEEEQLYPRGFGQHQTTSRLTKAAAKVARQNQTNHRTFEENVKRLTAYKIEYGDCYVPHDYKRDPKLGWWVMSVRNGSTKLSEEQRLELTQLGFAMNITEINASKNQQIVLEVCLIVYLSSLFHSFSNIQHSLRQINRNILKKLLSCGHLSQKLAKQD
jgi:hypothetical protein